MDDNELRALFGKIDAKFDNLELRLSDVQKDVSSIPEIKQKVDSIF